MSSWINPKTYLLTYLLRRGGGQKTAVVRYQRLFWQLLGG